MPAAKLRIIADTNTWLSRFILPASVTGRRMRQLSADTRLELVFSQELKEEVRRVLQRPKFHKYLTAENLTLYRAYLDAFPTTAVTSTVALCRDPKDNFLLNLALDSQADYLVSGDEDLLTLGSIGNTQILTLASFAHRMGYRGVKKQFYSLRPAADALARISRRPPLPPAGAPGAQGTAETKNTRFGVFSR